MVINTHRFLLKTLDDYDGVVGKALLSYRTCINEICTKPMCTIDKCLYCHLMRVLKPRGNMTYKDNIFFIK